MLSEVYHQDQAVRFLRSVVDGRFKDPLLLVGEEGVGRRFSAMQAIKETFCQEGRQSGCTCADCFKLDRGCHPDLTVVSTIDDKFIKVESIRETLATAWNAPLLASCRFIVIDGVDKLTMEGANALLKVLEEPPPSTRFILLAESYQRVIPTVRSRCGKISYQPLPDGFVLSVLQRFEKDDVKASIYARMGEGSVGRSISYLGSGRLALRDRVLSLVQLALDGDIPSLFSTIDTIGPDLPLALRFVEHLLHDLLMVPIAPHRMINLDQKETVQKLRGRAKLSEWVRLGAEAREARERYRRTKINLSFHVKAMFADTFPVV